MENEVKVWGIHTPEINESLFTRDNTVAIGWVEMGDLSQLSNSREDFRARYAEVYPDAKEGNVRISVGILYRFVHELKVGDYIVFPSKSDRMVHIGIVEGDYQFNANESHYRHQRKVTWLKHLPRTAFSQGALYEIGSAITFFMIKNYTTEFLEALGDGFENRALQEDESVAVTADEIKESTRDFILKELTRQLKGYELEEFIADLLRAMGYRTKVSTRGGDHGVDIVAYKDELPPRILVQVKSTDGDIQESVIQSLRGAMKDGDYGLFVTLSDYRDNAKAYLDNTPIIKGINGAEVIDLVLRYYEQLSEKYRRMIPLERVYIPVMEDNA